MQLQLCGIVLPEIVEKLRTNPNAIFDDIDLDHNGCVRFREFAGFCLKYGLPAPDLTGDPRPPEIVEYYAKAERAMRRRAETPPPKGPAFKAESAGDAKIAEKKRGKRKGVTPRFKHPTEEELASMKALQKEKNPLPEDGKKGKTKRNAATPRFKKPDGYVPGEPSASPSPSPRGEKSAAKATELTIAQKLRAKAEAKALEEKALEESSEVGSPRGSSFNENLLQVPQDVDAGEASEALSVMSSGSGKKKKKEKKEKKEKKSKEGKDGEHTEGGPTEGEEKEKKHKEKKEKKEHTEGGPTEGEEKEKKHKEKKEKHKEKKAKKESD